MKPRFRIQQKITAFVNKYTVFLAAPDASKSEASWHVQQKRLALKEKVVFYADEAQTRIDFIFRAKKVLDVHSAYIVETTAGKQLGSFKKDFGASLVNSTWYVFGPKKDEPAYIVRESNATLAVLRRFITYIPVVGDVADVIMALFKYHFSVVDASTNEIVGRHIKTTLFRDNYVFELTDAAYDTVDRRVWVALSVALDALQSR